MSVRSIYDIPPTEQFQFNVGETLSRDLRWTAYSCKVDNPTLQWIHIKNTLQYIPPGQMGYVVPIPSLDRAEAEWAAPPPQVQGPAVAGAQAVLTFYSYDLPPSGTALPVLVSKQQTPNIGNFFSQVGAGVNVIEAPAVGLQLYVIAGILAVPTAALGGLAAVMERQPGGADGRTIAQIGTDLQTDGVSWSASGFIVTPGWGIHLRVFGVGSAGLSILYSK